MLAGLLPPQGAICGWCEMRTLALWFPDWPVQAAAIEELVDPTQPAVITAAYRVHVCNAAAREHGIRRHMKLRHAQALFPHAQVLDHDESRDGRVFSMIVDALDAVIASVEMLRPGLLVVNADAAARYHGGEAQAAEKIIDAAALMGVDCFAGLADDVNTAIIAAHTQHTVPKGGSAEFLARQPLSFLKAEPVLGCLPETVESFENLGLTTLGQIAQLDPGAVATRFGRAGSRCLTVATARDDRVVARADALPDLSVSLVPEAPIERVDAAAFAARMLAAKLHQRLSEAGVSCVRLKVQARCGAQLLERVWHTRTQLTEDATADRVRWQLDGWITSGGQGALDELMLIPVECEVPRAWNLFGRTPQDEQAQKVIARVQSTLGMDAVLTPTYAGGRGVEERIKLVPYGERAEELDRLAQGSWPGAIPGPLPAMIGHPSAKVVIVDSAGGPVYVTAEAVLNADPAGMQWGASRYLIKAWAGPWPVQGRWWKDERPVARLQLVGVDKHGHEKAWLLLWCGQWRVEASYE